MVGGSDTTLHLCPRCDTLVVVSASSVTDNLVALGAIIDEAIEAFDRVASWKASRVELALWVERRRLRPRPRLERRPPEARASWVSCLRAFVG